MSRTARYWLVVAAVLGALGLTGWLLRVDTRRYRIPSESMVPTLKIDDRIIVNEDAYDDDDPRIGDIVVIHPPAGATGETARQCGARVRTGQLCPRPSREVADVSFVERIVAGPGDRLRVVDGKAIVDGKPLDEPYAQACGGGMACTFRGEITIPDGHYFMMGDNRGASDDSRFWGPVPRDQIVGRVDDCSLLGLKCERTSDP
ncbi:MAG: signal peptidase I [Actinomycetota bacterium]|nr:signal peptidase I [Actinomycetota bacterium]